MVRTVALRYPVVWPAISPTRSPLPRSASVSSWPSPVTPTILAKPSTSTNTWVAGSPSTQMTAPGG